MVGHVRWPPPTDLPITVAEREDICQKIKELRFMDCDVAAGAWCA
jgi:hypothetical protein